MPNRILTVEELAVEFHPTLNGVMTRFSLDLPHDVSYHWLGKCEHGWRNTIKERLQGKNCVPCAIRKVISGLTDLQTVMPELAARWHPTKNEGMLPKQVTPNSTFLAWWIGECGHEYPSLVHHQASGKRCSVCAGKRVLAGFNDLASKNPCLAAQWHPTKNDGLLPTQVTAFSEKLVWWYRESCGHEWQSRICDRKDGLECSICLGFILLVGFNDLETKAPELAAEWHPTLNGDLLPSQITTGYSTPVWWLGPCGHPYPARVDYRYLQGTQCLACSGRYVLVGVTDLGTTHPFESSQWDYEANDGLTPQDVTAGSNKEVGWVCEENHHWRAQVNSRTDKKHPNGCKNCIKKVSLTEIGFAEVVRSFGHKMYTSNRSLLRGMEVDVYLPDDRVAIEFNGLYWHSDANDKPTDYHSDKWSRVYSKGIRLLHIWEDDWQNNRSVVEQLIRDAIAQVADMQSIEIEKVDEAQAAEFIMQRRVEGLKPGVEYLAAMCDSKIVAVLGYTIEGVACRVSVYAAASVDARLLESMLSHIINEHEVTSIEYTSINGMDEIFVFEASGFTVAETIKPDYTYYVSGRRVDRDQFESAHAVGAKPRIWDAGKTRWVKPVG